MLVTLTLSDDQIHAMIRALENRHADLTRDLDHWSPVGITYQDLWRERGTLKHLIDALSHAHGLAIVTTRNATT